MTQKNLYRVRYYKETDGPLFATRQMLVLADNEDQAIEEVSERNPPDNFDGLQTGHQWKKPVEEVSFREADQ